MGFKQFFKNRVFKHGDIIYYRTRIDFLSLEQYHPRMINELPDPSHLYPEIAQKEPGPADVPAKILLHAMFGYSANDMLSRHWNMPYSHFARGTQLDGGRFVVRDGYAFRGDSWDYVILEGKNNGVTEVRVGKGPSGNQGELLMSPNAAWQTINRLDAQQDYEGYDAASINTDGKKITLHCSPALRYRFGLTPDESGDGFSGRNPIITWFEIVGAVWKI